MWAATMWVITLMICFKSFMHFLGFSMQSHAESCGNYVEKSCLDPKHTKIDKRSELGHVQTCPSGPHGPIEGEPLQKHKKKHSADKELSS